MIRKLSTNTPKGMPIPHLQTLLPASTPVPNLHSHKTVTRWKENVVYHLYPHSFCDGNGDGIGDLQGILSKLDYLQSLGVDLIKLLPDPMANAITVKAYSWIFEFGSRDELDTLTRQLRQRGIRLELAPGQNDPSGSWKLPDAAHSMAHTVAQWHETDATLGLRAAKMLLTWKLALPGVSHIQQGDEIGAEPIFSAMPWNAAALPADSWPLPGIHIDALDKDPASILNHCRKMIELRKEEPALFHGRYTSINSKNPAVQAFTRTWNNHSLLVLLNVTPVSAPFQIQLDLSKSELLISNYYTLNEASRLRPYEASIYWL